MPDAEYPLAGFELLRMHYYKSAIDTVGQNAPSGDKEKEPVEFSGQSIEKESGPTITVAAKSPLHRPQQRRIQASVKGKSVSRPDTSSQHGNAKKKTVPIKAVGGHYGKSVARQ